MKVGDLVVLEGGYWIGIITHVKRGLSMYRVKFPDQEPCWFYDTVLEVINESR